MSIFNRQRILQIIRSPLEVVLLRYVFGLMILAPTLMLILWWASPRHHLEIQIINKSVPDFHRTEHASLSWILKHERIVNSQGAFYDREKDYWGFHPRPGGDFLIRDMSQTDSTRMDSLARATDMVYFADAYGVYSHDYGGDQKKPNRLLYGGVNRSDYDFLKLIREQNKLIIAEFSFFDHPTRNAIRDSLETLFGLKWSGWIGRYFVSLDTTANDALPPWVVALYQQSHPAEWPFRDSGIVLVRDEEIVILEYGIHLELETPQIETQEVYAATYGLPEMIRYPFWFDIVSSPQQENQVISIFHLPVNPAGIKLLEVHGVPRLFPAVIKQIGEQPPFYYFAGDFSDNPVVDGTADFLGIHIFQSFFYAQDQMDDRRGFFWKYYRPLMGSILQQEVLRINR